MCIVYINISLIFLILLNKHKFKVLHKMYHDKNNIYTFINNCNTIT